MKTSNKLLMGLLLTVLLFVTVMLGTARMYTEKEEAGQEVVSPPDAPAVPDTPAAPEAPSPLDTE